MKKSIATFSAAAAAAALAVSLAPRVAADELAGRPESVVTFSDPTEIPGKVLPPGRYILKIKENQPSWNVVTFQRAEDRETVATVMAAPHSVKDAAAGAVLVYFRLPGGQNKALRSWFPSGEPDGEDFIYPKARAEELARLSGQPAPPSEAMAEKNETPKESLPETSTSTASTETTREAETSNSSVRSEANTPPETTTAGVTTEPELPRTASPFPLLALAGASALGIGLAARRLAV